MCRYFAGSVEPCYSAGRCECLGPGNFSVHDTYRTAHFQSESSVCLYFYFILHLISAYPSHTSPSCSFPPSASQNQTPIPSNPIQSTPWYIHSYSRQSLLSILANGSSTGTNLDSIPNKTRTMRRCTRVHEEKEKLPDSLLRKQRS